MLKKIITKNILLLSAVSFLTDISSEMLYPVMPIYLKSIGFSVLLIGILEGIAEATAGLSKGYFGKQSDVTGKRTPFVTIGYFLSSLSKPMLGLFVYPVWIFLARTLDRLGKGIRTSARDAILSSETSTENKAKVFGFHRGADTLGAAIGPFLALIYLSIYPEQYRTLFFIAFIPAILGVMFTFLIKEKDKSEIAERPKTSKNNFFAFLGYWKESVPEYKKLVTGLFAFTLFNSSDIFLLLMIKHLGYSDEKVIWIYIFYNLIYALTSYPAGILADKFGFRKNFIAGLLMFVFVYAGMASAPGQIFLYILFIAYGLYASFTEGVSKAWITNISEKKDTATALGFYTGLNSIFSLAASVVAGLIWYNFNPEAMFIFSAAGTMAVILYFVFGKIKFSQNKMTA